jgi:predicted acetyltransferase
MNNIKLVPISVFDGKEIWQMLQELPSNDNGFINGGNSIPYEKFGEFINSRIKMANGIDLNPKYVPQCTYWLFRDDFPIGMSKLRIRLTNDLLIEGGNIGYGIRPSERKKGYGSKILELTLDRARRKGLDTVLLTCDELNIASKKTIERNGGKLEKLENGHCYYWIVL